MLTVEKKKKYTADDYMMLEEGAPFQLINYDLIMSPSPLVIHQQILFNLSEIIIIYHTTHGRKGQWMYSAMDVKFDEGNILQPDVLYITEERRGIIKDRVEGAPDIVFEILSPSNAYYDLRQKKNIYERFGVKEYFIIDPIEQSVELHALKDGVYHLLKKAQNDETLNSTILQGYSINIADLFK